MSQQINLLNPTLLTVKEWLNADMIAILTGTAVMLMFAVHGWTSYRVMHLGHEQQAITQELVSLKQQLDVAIKQQQRAPTQALLEQLTMAETTLKEHQQVQTFLQGGYFGNKHGFSNYMATFARQSMKGLWLTNFSIDGSLSDIKISGRALHPDLVPQYLAGLGQEPILRGREFDTLEMSSVVLAANAIPVLGNITVPSIPLSIIEFKFQSQEGQAVTETKQSAVQGKKY